MVEDVCEVGDCTSSARRRGWCGAHYQRWLKHGDPLLGGRKRVLTGGQCAADESCERVVIAAGMCHLHYHRQLRGRPLAGPSKRPTSVGVNPCVIDGCEGVQRARGWCDHHYKRWLNHGDPLATPRRKKRVSSRGVGPGRPSKNGQGYVNVYWPEHPNSRADGKVLQHTVVMAETIGRPLLPGESVHHRNGVRDDNDPENLELWASIPQPSGQRVRDLIAYANKIHEQYGDDPLLFP